MLKNNCQCITPKKRHYVFDVINKNQKCTVCKGFITVKHDQSKIVFSFETDGSLTAKDVIIESAKILKNKYNELGKLVKNIK